MQIQTTMPEAQSVVGASTRPSHDGECIPELVHARALETPEAPALAAGLDRLTYRELDERANHLAGELRALGAGPDTVVALCAPRSPEMVVGALAIMKSGAAYLPLDPSYPPDRLAFIVNDAGCSLRLIAPGMPEDVRDAFGGAGTIDLRGPRAAAPPPVVHAAHHLAYVIYTSGSTGQPKGVEISHASLQNLVRWHHRAFGVGPSDRASHVASVGFDAAVWEIWPYLAAGAEISIPDDAVRGDPEALRDWLVSQGITIGFVPTPIAERLIALPWPETTRLRSLLTGGDTLHGHPPAGLPFVVHNNYGPTECTVVATSIALRPGEQPERRPTIGRPIDHTEIWILDESMAKVPVGTPGEIFIGGAGLARGYRNRPDLTAERFVPNPFQEAGRLYRTGDRARWLADGQIVFLERTDDQIKIRGFRIEPSEIVTTLNECPGVAASAVVAEDLGGGNKRLVAYVVEAVGTRLTKSGMQRALGARLPDYMVPGVFVRVDSLPVGPHGKLDRRALPAPNQGNTVRDVDGAGPQAPQGEIQECVAGLVRTLLGVEVAADDNFFVLGGHSLFGTQLIARICNLFGTDMSLRDVFEAPTVALLSTRIEQQLLAKLETMTEEESRGFLAEQDEAVLT